MRNLTVNEDADGLWSLRDKATNKIVGWIFDGGCKMSGLKPDALSLYTVFRSFPKWLEGDNSPRNVIHQSRTWLGAFNAARNLTLN